MMWIRQLKTMWATLLAIDWSYQSENAEAGQPEGTTKETKPMAKVIVVNPGPKKLKAEVQKRVKGQYAQSAEYIVKPEQAKTISLKKGESVQLIEID